MFCQLHMTYKVKKEMFMYQLVFQNQIFGFLENHFLNLTFWVKRPQPLVATLFDQSTWLEGIRFRLTQEICLQYYLLISVILLVFTIEK